MVMSNEITALLATLMDIVSAVGGEFALFGCAAAAYLLFSGGLPLANKSPRSKKPSPVPVRSHRNPVKADAPQRTGGGSSQAPPAHASHPHALRSRQTPPDAMAKPPAAEKGDQKADPGRSAKDDVTRAGQIRALGRAGDLPGATALFDESLPSFTSELSGAGGSARSATLLLNNVLDACAECGDLGQAFSYLARAQEAGLADAVSFNTVMKGCLAEGKEDTAERVLTDMIKSGIQATQASFHGLINARVSSGDRRGAWQLLAKMQNAGVTPNAVTCAILLKATTAKCHASDVQRILDLVETSKQPLDDVLLSSLADACLRTGQLALLTDTMTKDRNQSVSLSAPTYGSLIKSHGQSRDVGRCWALWRDMLARGVKPSQITVGCMVEALVSNGRAEEAWQLVQELLEDGESSLLINTVSFSTLLKGFAKWPQKVVMMYEEMRARKIECNIITYNTILNAFAGSGEMARAPKLLEDMKMSSPPVELDMITYSTLIKGFCSSGELSKALSLLADMKDEGKFVPDEVLYNSLLDGCAREQRVTDAMKLISDMRVTGVKPSNYTLSMLVKLMGRCRMLDQAFALFDDLSKEFSFRPNIQVYTCLIQACFQNGQTARATSLLDRILEDGLSPDEKLFTALVRGCLQARKMDLAVQMVRHAYHGKRPVGIDLRTLDEVYAKLGVGSNAARALKADVTNVDVHGSFARPTVRAPPTAGTTWRSGSGATSRCAVGKACPSGIVAAAADARLAEAPWRSNTCDARHARDSSCEASTCAGSSSGSTSDASSANDVVG